ncbi:MAG: hypothetical protein LBK59_06290 [Bifidobacteriaceae bacterium]|jgi:hypothetical protein|nr:hypothetical protein [Bifidobacteriaceae bacterium]
MTRILVRLAVGLTALAVGVVGVALALGARERWTPIAPQCTATANGDTASLAVDQTANAALIAAVAERRELPARAVTIALATALQESKLRNIDYGDRDSIGLFQQRPSQGWGTVEEIMDPVYATKKFFSALVTVPDYEALPITEAAQAVQRSAFPLAYADHEETARRFASALTGHSPAGLACHLPPAETPGSLDELAANLTSAFGKGVGVASEPPSSVDDAGQPAGGHLTAVAPTDREGWAVAAWAVAHADAERITAVEAGSLRWERTWGEWRDRTDPTQLPAGETVIYLAE